MTQSMSDRRPFDAGPLADPEERQAIFATLDSFRQYRRQCHYESTHRRRQNLYALPTQQWRVLAAPPLNLLNTLNDVDDAIDCNADIADAILEFGLQNFDLPAALEKGSSQFWHGTAKPGDMAKVHSTIRQFYRDWSAKGYADEVEPLFKLLLSDLASVSMTPSTNVTKPVVLLPGAGLGRLVFELSLQGYDVEGNEISYHQLFASNFVLNATMCAQQYKLYPFVTTFTNHKTRANQLSSVLIPDVHPASVMAQRKSRILSPNLEPGVMNMTAGDFLTSYGDEDSRQTFDAVISVYFIDTAPNLIRYIETVRNCLKPNGVWINIGPLLWHFDDRSVSDHKGAKPASPSVADADTDIQAERGQSTSASTVDAGIAEPGSFELTDEEVLSLLQKFGFKILEHNYIPVEDGGYIQDPNSMIQNRYESSHWVARKVSQS